MARPTDIKIVEEIKRLSKTGMVGKEIAKMVNVCHETVKRILRKANSYDPHSVKKLHANLAEDRLTLPLNEVAAKYNLSASYVSQVTNLSDLRSKFVRMKRPLKPKEPAGLNTSLKLKRLRRKKQEAVPLKEDALLGIQKGNAKLMKGEKVHPQRKHEPTRSIPMLDSKNTILFVKLTDTRSNDQIRSEWHAKQAEGLRKLAS